MVALHPEHLARLNIEYPERYRGSLEYLVERGYIASVDQYVEEHLGKSDRIIGFYRISQAQKLAKEMFSLDILAPSVIALRHNLWLEWVETRGQYHPSTKSALADLFTMSLASSETNDVALRHAVWEEGEAQSRGMSKMHLKTVDDIFAKLNAQYQDRLDRGWYERWQKKGDVEVTLNLQEFTDPQTHFDFDSYKETGDEAPYFENGTPPIGGYATTSNNGQLIKIKCAYGDNRAAITDDSICDTITVEVVVNGSDKPDLKIVKVEPGTRQHIVLDRDDKLVHKARLLPFMQTGPIKMSDLEILRIAAFAHCASKLPSINGNCYTEFSLGRRGFYFNQLNPYEAREIPPPSLFEKAYTVAAVVNSFHDIDSLTTLIPDSKLPGAISIGEGIQALSPTEIGQAVSQIEAVIAARLKQKMSRSKRRFWEKLIYFTRGSDAEHRTVNALSTAQHNFITVPRLPQMQVGDIIKPLFREETGSYWIQNTTLAGNGTTIYNLSHWHQPPEADQVGPKTAKVERLRKRYNLRTPGAIALTTKAFDAILKANHVDGRWRNLRNLKSAENIAEEFRYMQQNLTKIPESIWKELVIILQRQYPDWQTREFPARSTNLLEDIGLPGSSNFAGSFSSFLHNQLLPDNRQLLYDSEDNPLDLYTGVIEVIRSLFNPEISKIFENKALSFESRQELLLNWKMPVLIMPLVEGLVSGVTFRYNPQQQNLAKAKQEVIITMQPGLEGGVRANDKRPKLRFIINAYQPSLKNTIITLGYGANEDYQVINPADLIKHLPPGILLAHVFELAKTSARVSKGEGKPQDMEYVINKDLQTIYTQTRTQQLPPSLRI